MAEKLKMKAGTYYVGDPYYALSHRWEEVCNQTIEGREVKGGVFVLAGSGSFSLFPTLHGDGTYLGSDCHYYPVDSGSLGCVRVEDAIPSAGSYGSALNKVEFSEDFTVSSSGGVITIGYISIDTNEWEEEDADPDIWGDNSEENSDD